MSRVARMTGRDLQKGVTDLMTLHGECILGTGASNHGYYRQMRKGVRREQHVWAWMDRHGAVPSGMIVHHVCENQGCVNPQHLSLVSPAEHSAIHRKRDFCKYGHSRIDNTTKSGNCRTCMIEYLRQYRLAHPRRIAA